MWFLFDASSLMVLRNYSRIFCSIIDMARWFESIKRSFKEFPEKLRQLTRSDASATDASNLSSPTTTIEDINEGNTSPESHYSGPERLHGLRTVNLLPTTQNTRLCEGAINLKKNLIFDVKERDTRDDNDYETTTNSLANHPLPMEDFDIKREWKPWELSLTTKFINKMDNLCLLREAERYILNATKFRRKEALKSHCVKQWSGDTRKPCSDIGFLEEFGGVSLMTEKETVSAELKISKRAIELKSGVSDSEDWFAAESGALSDSPNKCSPEQQQQGGGALSPYIDLKVTNFKGFAAQGAGLQAYGKVEPIPANSEDAEVKAMSFETLLDLKEHGSQFFDEGIMYLFLVANSVKNKIDVTGDRNRPYIMSIWYHGGADIPVVGGGRRPKRSNRPNAPCNGQPVKLDANDDTNLLKICELVGAWDPRGAFVMPWTSSMAIVWQFYYKTADGRFRTLARFCRSSRYKECSHRTTVGERSGDEERTKIPAVRIR